MANLNLPRTQQVTVGAIDSLLEGASLPTYTDLVEALNLMYSARLLNERVAEADLPPITSMMEKLGLGD